MWGKTVNCEISQNVMHQSSQTLHQKKMGNFFRDECKKPHPPKTILTPPNPS